MSSFQKLNEIADVIDSLHKTPKYSDTGGSMVRCTDVSYGLLNLEQTYKVDEEVFSEFSRRYKPTQNDIIITRVGSYGITALVHDINFCLGQNTSAIVPKINPRYLYLALNSPVVKRQIEFSVVGSTQKTLSLKAINSLDIPRFDPNIEDQIANVGSTLDDKIELNRQTNQTLEQIAQAIFKSWFVDFEPSRAKQHVLALQQRTNSTGNADATVSEEEAAKIVELAAQAVISGSLNLADIQAIANPNTLRQKLENSLAAKLVNQTDAQRQQLIETASYFPNKLVQSELNEIPEGWLAIPLYDTARYVNGAAFTAKDFSDDRSGLPIVKIAELKQGISSGTKFTNAEIKQKYFITDDDVLYSWSGSPETSLEVFKWFGGDGWLNQHIFKLNFDSEAQKYFTYHLLKHMKPVLISTAQQKQTTGLGHITVADMKRIKIVQPSSVLLTEFSQKISSLYEQASLLTKENISLSTLRDTLLPKLLSGELAVNAVN